MVQSNGSRDARWEIPPAETTRPIAPRPAEGARRVETRPAGPAPFVWVSTHGGAGSSSLAASSGVGAALTGVWPAPALGWSPRVVLVGRSNTTGLDAVGLFLQQWASRLVDDIEVRGVVITADAPGRAPKTLRERTVALRSITPHVHTLGWIEPWRLAPGSAHDAVRKIADSILTTEGN